MTISDLYRATDGPPLTTGQLGQLIGFSDAFVRLEIAAGEIKAIRCGRGRVRKVYRIPWPEARRYVQQMGLLSTEEAQTA